MSSYTSIYYISRTRNDVAIGTDILNWLIFLSSAAPFTRRARDSLFIYHFDPFLRYPTATSRSIQFFVAYHSLYTYRVFTYCTFFFSHTHNYKSFFINSKVIKSSVSRWYLPSIKFSRNPCKNFQGSRSLCTCKCVYNEHTHIQQIMTI